MATATTGCQGPFVRGTNGTCPCWGCKCCPPNNCYKSITIYFDCGTPYSTGFPAGCSTITASAIPALVTSLPALPFGEIPEFDLSQPIKSEDGAWVYAIAGGGCSIPCQAVTVTLAPAGTNGVCCIEYANGTLYAAGNGDIDATISPTSGPGSCENYYVHINGQPTPTAVADGDVLTVELFSQDAGCCAGVQTGIKNPTAAMAFQRGGKLFNPQQSLLNNVLARQLMMQRRLR